MAKSKAEVNFMEHLKPLLPAGGDASELEAAAQTLAGLSPENHDLLAAVQESPYRLTTLQQFREFPANTEYFVLEPNISKVEDVGWHYLAQHLDVLLPPELLDAIDPVPFGNHAMQEEQGCFTSKGYHGYFKQVSLSGFRRPEAALCVCQGNYQQSQTAFGR